MTTKSKLAKGISLSCITVSDINKAKHLFVDLLGLDLKEFVEEYKWMEIGGKDEEARLGVGEYVENSEYQDIKAGSNAIISILVGNLEEAKEHLEANGIEFLGNILEIPGEVKMILFKDLDGNRYFLTESLK